MTTLENMSERVAFKCGWKFSCVRDADIGCPVADFITTPSSHVRLRWHEVQAIYDAIDEAAKPIVPHHPNGDRVANLSHILGLTGIYMDGTVTAAEAVEAIREFVQRAPCECEACELERKGREREWEKERDKERDNAE